MGMEGFGSPDFWVALLQIIGVNIVLSGDNAVVIALAARGLPQHQQKKAVAWGSGAAVIMRIILTIVAVELLELKVDVFALKLAHRRGLRLLHPDALLHPVKLAERVETRQRRQGFADLLLGLRRAMPCNEHVALRRCLVALCLQHRQL